VKLHGCLLPALFDASQPQRLKPHAMRCSQMALQRHGNTGWPRPSRGVAPLALVASAAAAAAAHCASRWWHVNAHTSDALWLACACGVRHTCVLWAWLCVVCLYVPCHRRTQGLATCLWGELGLIELWQINNS
jgi:hypothetical protein